MSVEQFLKSLVAHGLIGGDAAAAVPAEMLARDADELARQWVRDGKLTKFQAAAVYQGKADGLVLGNYVILDRLGAGGMGQVFRARHRRMDRIVALKMLSKKSLGSSEALERFQREVKAAARLTHPNIVTAHDADEAGGMHFLVMEFVEGSDLGALVKKQGPLLPLQAAEYLLQAARGLEHAHAQGIIHRDIKPSNLLVDAHGTIKVLDMGLARFQDPLATAGNDLTHSGSIMGTIDFMAPEQAMDSRQADARSDLYGLGCTLYYVLTGRPPYEADTVVKRLTAHQQAAIPRLSAARPDVLPALDAVCQRLLAKNPAGRFQSAKELISALEACMSSPPLPTPLPAAGPPQAMPVQAVALSRSPSASGIGEMASIVLPGDSDRRRPAKKRAKRWPLAAAVGCLLAAAGGYAWFASQHGAAPLPDIVEARDSSPPAAAPVLATPTVVPKPTDDIASRQPMTPSPEEPPAAAVASAPPAAALPVATPSAAPEPMPPPALTASSPAPVANAAEPPAPAATSAATSGDNRLPIPGETEQERARQLLKEVFKQDFAQAKQPKAKVDLAEKLLKQADTTQADAASSYVMLHTAADLAIDAVEPTLVGRAIGALAVRFQIDPLADTASAIERMLAKRNSPETARVLATAALDRVDEAVGEQQYDHARRLADLALTAARKSKDAALIKQVVERGKSVAAARQLFEAKEKAEATLAARPDDPAANLVLGKYLCFAGGDWGTGLPHLAKGNDQALRELAAVSLATAAEPEAQAALADRWWQSAEKAKGKDKPDLQAGAAHWYALAAPGLAGLAKVRVEQRLQAVGAPLTATADVGAPPAAGNSAPRGKVPATISLVLAPGVSIQFGLIAPGTFKMGSPVSELGHARGEEQHDVVISKPYYLAVTETTQAQWQAVMNSNPSATLGDLSRPVQSVSPKDALALIARLNQSALGAAHVFRLPTEAEWEYACRADSQAAFCFGNDVSQLRDYAWYADNSGGMPHPVARLKPNAWGFYDMHGNVWEWCADWYSVDYYLHSERTDPRGPAEGDKHVNRGGHYAASAGVQRCATRGHDENHAAPYGFRLACDPVGGYRAPVVRRSTTAPAAGIAAAGGTARGVSGKSVPQVAGQRPVTFAQAQAERRVAEWVLAQGGKVKVVLHSAPAPDPPEIAAASSLPAEAFTLFGIALERDKTLSDKDLEPIGELSDLKELKINVTPIGDGGLAHLAGLAHLRILYLHSTKITDAGLKHLAGMHDMTAIYFSSASAVGDPGLTVLDGMPELVSLSVSHTHATDATLAHIGRLQKLQWLSVSGCRISDEGVKSLGALERLVSFEAIGCPITDAGVASLAGLPRLANLQLEKTSVTDRTLEVVAALPMLASINVRATRVTDAGVQRLRLARPQCQIDR